MSERTYAAYILASRRNGAPPIGVTNNLSLRVCQPRAGASEFTARYKVSSLVWCEYYSEISEGNTREKQLKK